MAPDYKEEIEKEYPWNGTSEISCARQGANWFLREIHLPALTYKDKEIERLRAELEEAKGLIINLNNAVDDFWNNDRAVLADSLIKRITGVQKKCNNFLNKPNP